MQEILSVDITAPSYTSGWGPFNDKRSVLNNDVRTLIEEGRSLFGTTDVLMGVTMHEGYMYFTDDEIENGITELRKMQMMRTYVRNAYTYHRQYIYDVIWHEYSNYERTEDAAMRRDEVMAMLGKFSSSS